MIPTEYMYNIIKVPFVYYTHTKKQQETFSNEIKHIFSKRGVWSMGVKIYILWGKKV